MSSQYLFYSRADIGGLLGLFLGCSILSIIEIIYFIFKSSILKIFLTTKVKNENSLNAIYLEAIFNIEKLDHRLENLERQMMSRHT